MKEKVYEIELTEEELEILSAIMNLSSFVEIFDYCIRDHRIVYYETYLKLQDRIQDIVNTNKHQNV